MAIRAKHDSGFKKVSDVGLSVGAPAYRVGKIVTAKISHAGKNVEFVSRSVAEARKLGQAIIRNEKKYVAKLIEVINSFTDDSDITVPLGEFSSIKIKQMPDGSDDYTKARFSPGLIIDFPSVQISTSHYVIDCRSCLTVCLDETRSKVWARFVLRSVDGNPGFGLDRDQIANFHTGCELISTKLIEATSELYRKDFERFLKKNVSFSSTGTLHFFTVDSGDIEIERDLEITSNLIESGALSDRIDQTALAQVMRMATEASHEKTRDHSSTGDFKLAKDAHFLIEEANDGTPVIFVAYANNDAAYFTGIASQATDDESMAIAEENDIKTFSNGLAAVSRLAMRVATNF
jgi:hypothetical protein